MRGDGDRAMRRRPWTAAEDEILRRLYPDRRAADVAAELERNVCQVHARAKRLGVRKSDAFNASPQSGRVAKGRLLPASLPYRFKPGQVSHNKGRHYQPGGRAAETQFKPGLVPHNTQPIGTEVWNSAGYLVRKISDARGLTQRQRWRFVHALIWEAAHGPVPRGFGLVFRNGNRADLRLDNLELVSDQERMRRNSIHSLIPSELKELIQLNGRLKRRIRERCGA
jgi:hypothetical protein